MHAPEESWREQFPYSLGREDNGELHEWVCKRKSNREHPESAVIHEAPQSINKSQKKLQPEERKRVVKTHDKETTSNKVAEYC